AGDNIVLAGNGSTLLTLGGGHDLLVVEAGRLGTTTIAGWQAGQDAIALSGYDPGAAAAALAGAAPSGGDLNLTLSDGTRITFLGTGSLSLASFV
ncbi:MAG TPA: hypothetical protein VGC80_09180, partial [Acetobacteraceae bacterium]